MSENAKRTYLGEKKVDLAKDEKYKDYTPAQWALHWIEAYGQIDGSHHKTWVLDQVARILNGAPVIGKIASWSDGYTEYRFTVGTSPTYKKWVKMMLGAKVDGEYEYDYDEGTPP